MNFSACNFKICENIFGKMTNYLLLAPSSKKDFLHRNPHNQKFTICLLTVHRTNH